MADAPTIYLSHSHESPGANCLVGRHGVKKTLFRPSLLVSYMYLEQFLRNIDRYSITKWAFDSGAYSVKNIGAELTLEKYENALLKIRDVCSPARMPVDVFGFDVIGDAKTSLGNAAHTATRLGLEVIPTYHLDDNDPAVLDEMSSRFKKVAIGGLVGKPRSTVRTFCEWVFSRIWPKQIHGFACVSRELLLSLPFHSVDSASWHVAPLRYGNWRGLGGRGALSWRGSKQDVSAEIRHFIELERESQWRWRNEMAQIA